MSFAERLRNYILARLQKYFSILMSALARVRRKVIIDSGTAIGLRHKLFTEVISTGGIGVELGVYKGTLSKYIMKVNQPRCLHLVDPWWKLTRYWNWAVGDKSTVRSFASLLLDLEEEISAGKVEFHIGRSQEILESFDDGYFDWAYVDSNHEYEQTKDELGLLKYKVKSDGIIAGDDWREEETHPHHGVCRAVKEFLEAEPDYQLIFQEELQWALKRKAGKVLDS